MQKTTANKKKRNNILDATAVDIIKGTIFGDAEDVKVVKGKKSTKSKRARLERIAVMEALDLKPREQKKLEPEGTNLRRDRRELRELEEQGRGITYKKITERVEELDVKILSVVELIANNRKKLAMKAFEVADRKIEAILSRGEPDMSEAQFALKAIEQTEYSGKKTEMPIVNINVKSHSITDIRKNFQEIERILKGCGVDLENIMNPGSNVIDLEKSIDC